MKRYVFWVTLNGKEGRTSIEAKQIVEARFPGAKVILAEVF